MKHFWIGVAILFLCLAVCIGVVTALSQITDHAVEMLDQALSAAEQGDLWQAERLTREAGERWQSHQGFFGVALRHADFDEINAMFREAAAFAQDNHKEEFAPLCVRLQEEIRHVFEMEMPYYYNVF